MASERRAAAFVDRDGTVIREREYLSDPAGVELIPGAVEGLLALQALGYRVVIVTNQSGIARGLYGDREYRAVEREVEGLLERAGVRVVASYHCPHHPEYTGSCECRKPAPGLFRLAADEHALDLARSVYIGDRVRDVAPALELGGRGVLVRTGYGDGEVADAPEGVLVADDLTGVAPLIGPPGPFVDRDGVGS
jgi:D-glycero-D-manno-heptose 1,7-bisphosphate phosphatase